MHSNSSVSGIKNLAAALQQGIKSRVKDVRETIEPRFLRKSKKKDIRVTAKQDNTEVVKAKTAKKKPATAEPVREVVPRNHAADRKWAILKKKGKSEASRKLIEKSNCSARKGAADVRVKPELNSANKIKEQNELKKPMQEQKMIQQRRTFLPSR